MPTTVNLRKMLHRKSAEYCTPIPAGNTVAGSFVVSDKSSLLPSHDAAYYVGGVMSIWNYNADQDAWAQIPNSGIAGTFGAGACGEFRAISALGGNITQTATAGTTTTLTTNQPIIRDLVGCKLRAVGGTGIGYVGVVSKNTLGANAIITVSPANDVAFDSTTQFQVFGGSLWFFNAGSGAVGFSVYDRATNAWTAKSVTNLPTTWGTDGQLLSTPGMTSNGGNGFVNGTATSGTATTLTDAGKAWPVNGWANYQVRITAGTGKGQIRTITSNTATALTVAAWTTTPDATSVYRIEGNDDVLYLFGNNAVTLYRYSISANTWSTLTPGAARSGAMGAGGTADWIDGVAATEWTDDSYGNHHSSGVIHQNGRYIYSFRGGATASLDIYDIAANTWVSGVTYGQQMETWSTGSCSVDLDGQIYIQKDVTGRIYKFDVAKNALDPFLLNPVPQGPAVAGDKMILTTYTDGGTTINFLYSLGHNRSELTRWLMV